MATNVKITKLPVRTNLFLYDDAVQLNEEYFIESNMIRAENVTGMRGEPFDSFTYKIIEDGIVSKNTGTVAINFATDKIGLPPLIQKVVDMDINTSFFFSSHVAPDNHFDRVRIKSIAGLGNWSYKGSPLVVGSVIMYYDIKNELKFTASNSAVKDQYSFLEYETGNISFFHNQTNWISVNTKSDGAELYNTDANSDYDGVIETYSFGLMIVKGMSEEFFELEIDLSTYSSIGVHPNNKVEIRDSNNNILFTYNTPLKHNLSDVLTLTGDYFFNIVVFRETASAIAQLITLTLKNVNGLPENVNAQYNSVILNIPVTP